MSKLFLFDGVIDNEEITVLVVRAPNVETAITLIEQQYPGTATYFGKDWLNKVAVLLSPEGDAAIIYTGPE
jgi:hypothetical protein